MIPTKVTDSRSIWKSRVPCSRNWQAWSFPTKRRTTTAKLSLHAALCHPIRRMTTRKRLGWTLGLEKQSKLLGSSVLLLEGADESGGRMIAAIVDGVVVACRFSAFVQGVQILLDLGTWKNNLWDLCCCNFTIQFRACAKFGCARDFRSPFCTDKWHVWTSHIIFQVEKLPSDIEAAEAEIMEEVALWRRWKSGNPGVLNESNTGRCFEASISKIVGKVPKSCVYIKIMPHCRWYFETSPLILRLKL